MIHKTSTILLLSLYFTISSSVSFASSQNLPLYEIGIGGAALRVEDYPAADQSHVKYLAVPTFIYRGEIFRSEKGGVRANFFNSKNLKLDLSLGASLPSSAKDNKARENMDDLDLLMEMGPALTYIIVSKEDLSFKFSLPIRLVASTDFQFSTQRGARVNPEFRLKYNVTERWRVGMSLEWHYGTEKLNDYFYQVSSSDATATREQFNAQEGYIGQSFGGYIGADFGAFSSFLGFRVNQYHQSVNTDSPLFRNKINTNVFLGMNYFFYRSKKLSKSVEKDSKDV